MLSFVNVMRLLIYITSVSLLFVLKMMRSTKSESYSENASVLFAFEHKGFHCKPYPQQLEWKVESFDMTFRLCYVFFNDACGTRFMQKNLPIHFRSNPLRVSAGYVLRKKRLDMRKVIA